MGAKKGESEPVSPASPRSDRSVNPVLHFLLVGNDVTPHAPKTTPQDTSILRAYVGPILLILYTFGWALFAPLVIVHYNGFVSDMVQDFNLSIFSKIIMPSWKGLQYLAIWTVVQAALMQLLPGKKVYGPITPTGEKPEYRQNGVLAWLVTHLGWLILGPLTGIVDFAAVYTDFATIVSSCNLFALPFTIFLCWKGANYPSTRDAVVTGNALFDFFQGVELHPRLFGLPLKQLINCRISMMAWALLPLCFAQGEYQIHGRLSTGMFVTVLLHAMYMFKFFWWEAGYFASIDVMHDRCGYYIVWGLFVWVPSCYCIPFYSLVNHPIHWTYLQAAGMWAIGATALYINYDADHQRMIAREKDGKLDIWGKPAKVIRAEYTTTDGSTRKSLLLACGYWAISRHFHYVPELALAFTISWAGGQTMAISWLYFAFLLCLLIDRASRDEVKCREKYTKYWTEYCKIVPYKIVPFIY